MLLDKNTTTKYTEAAMKRINRLYNRIRKYDELPVILLYIIVCLVMMICMAGCRTRKVQDGIYRVKVDGKWYVTDQKKGFKPRPRFSKATQQPTHTPSPTLTTKTPTNPARKSSANGSRDGSTGLTSSSNSCSRKRKKKIRSKNLTFDLTLLYLQYHTIETARST